MAASALLLSSALPLGLRDLLPASKIKSLWWHYKRDGSPLRRLRIWIFDACNCRRPLYGLIIDSYCCRSAAPLASCSRSCYVNFQRNFIACPALIKISLATNTAQHFDRQSSPKGSGACDYACTTNTATTTTTATTATARTTTTLPINYACHIPGRQQIDSCHAHQRQSANLKSSRAT